MVRKGAHWKQSAAHKGIRIIRGRKYILAMSGNKRDIERNARYAIDEGPYRHYRIVKSLYYGDYELWLSRN